jgi:hypothetical protein
MCSLVCKCGRKKSMGVSRNCAHEYTMSATSITTATTATAATAATSDDMGSLMIELIDIGETSPVTDGLLHV